MSDRDPEKVSWISSAVDADGFHPKPNRQIDCQGCRGIIVFNAEEIMGNLAAGRPTSTPCRFCGWHPAYPPEPWKPYP